MEERRFHPLDYLAALQRRKWWLIVPIVVCAIGGVILLNVLPREYKSHAKIGVAAPSLSNDLLRGLSSLDAVERQRAVSQYLLGTTVLERVMREEQLLPSAKPEDRAAWLRKRISIDVEAPFGVSTRAGDRGFDSGDSGTQARPAHGHCQIRHGRSRLRPAEDQRDHGVASR